MLVVTASCGERKWRGGGSARNNQNAHGREKKTRPRQCVIHDNVHQHIQAPVRATGASHRQNISYRVQPASSFVTNAGERASGYGHKGFPFEHVIARPDSTLPCDIAEAAPGPLMTPAAHYS